MIQQWSITLQICATQWCFFLHYSLATSMTNWLKFSLICYVMLMLGDTKWGHWSLAITKRCPLPLKGRNNMMFQTCKREICFAGPFFEWVQEVPSKCFTMSSGCSSWLCCFYAQFTYGDSHPLGASLQTSVCFQGVQTTGEHHTKNGNIYNLGVLCFNFLWDFTGTQVGPI